MQERGPHQQCIYYRHSDILPNPPIPETTGDLLIALICGNIHHRSEIIDFGKDKGLKS